MRPGDISIDGHLLSSHKIYCSTRPDIETPKRVIEKITVFGGAGDIIYDDGGYENTPISLSLWVNGTEEDISSNRRIVNKLFPQAKYLKVIFWFDPGLTYICYVEEPAKFSNQREGRGLIDIELKLSCKPFKLFNESHGMESLIKPTNGQKIVNNVDEFQLPKIKLVGNGDISFTLAGITMRFKNVDGHIWIDCGSLNLYKDVPTLDKSRNHLTNDLEYPFLYPKEQNNLNTISWSGNVSSVELYPRWRTLV